MKKFLALLLALIMCVGVLASCGNNNNNDATDAGDATLEDAKELLNSMMKDKNGKPTPNDYDVVAKLTIGETTFEVTWATDNANVKVKASSKDGFWTIDVPDVNAAEVDYKLTATIKAADGTTVNTDFTRKLPVIDNAGVETEFKAGVAYTMFMKQANLGYTVYALNTTQDNANKFINTTLDPKEAAAFYVEIVEGGYKIYTEIAGVKNYLHATATPKESGSGFTKAIGFAPSTDCVFSYDKTLALFTVKLSGDTFGVGTYNAFETISISEAKYFKADNINVKEGQFPVGLMTKEHADTLAPSVKPENKDPAADSLLTIAEAIALGNTKVKDQYTESKYYVEGTVKEIQSDSYGNLVITDGTNDLLVYGTYSEDGKTRFDKLANKPAVGDKIKVYGIIGKYNDAQMKNGWIVGAKAGEGSGDSGSSSTPTVNTTVVEAPVAGTAYKFGMLQPNKDNKIFFANGEMVSTYYFGTTENAAAAIDVYLEETTGGYYLYCMKGDAKTYINMKVSGTHVNAVYEATASTVYTLDATLKTLVADITVAEDTTKSGQYAFGNYGTYTSISTFNVTKADSFACKFYTVVEGEGGDTPVVPTPPACTEHVDANGDFVCDTANCGVVVEPAADSVLTIVQANALGQALKGAYSTNKYYVTGTIKQVYNTSFGNMYIKDANGVEFTVYGVDGYSDMAEKPVAGDVITVYATIGSHSGTSQMKNATMTDLQHTHAYDANNQGKCPCGAVDPNFVPSHECADGDDEDFICDNPDCNVVVMPAADSVLTVKQALALATLIGDTYTADKYYITGIVTSAPDATKGHLNLTADAETIYVYTVYDATGANRYDAMANKPVKGDTITVYGVIGNYSGSPQMKNVWVTNLVPHGDNHTYEGGVCTVCGATQPVAGTTTATFVAADAGLENAAPWIDYAVDENIAVSADQGTGSTAPAYYTTGSALRIYGKNSLIVTASNGKTIKSIKVVTDSKKIDNNATASAGTVSGLDTTEVLYTDINAATWTLTNGNSSGHYRIVSMEIIYA